MSVTLTLIILAVAVAALVFCGWRGAQPPPLLKVRMVPWRFLMILSVVLIVYLLVHLTRVYSGAAPVG